MLQTPASTGQHWCSFIYIYIYIKWLYGVSVYYQGSFSKYGITNCPGDGLSRHLGQYLLGCIDHATMLKYEAHQGLLHYNPCDYTLEVYSGSDFRLGETQQTRRSVSAGSLFLFGCLLYSTSRSQKALALSSAQAEIYAAASATSDAILMYHCLMFALGNHVEIRVHPSVDNSAARSFLCRVGEAGSDISV